MAYTFWSDVRSAHCNRSTEPPFSSGSHLYPLFSPFTPAPLVHRAVLSSSASVLASSVCALAYLPLFSVFSCVPGLPSPAPYSSVITSLGSITLSVTEWRFSWCDALAHRWTSSYKPLNITSELNRWWKCVVTFWLISPTTYNKKNTAFLWGFMDFHVHPNPSYLGMNSSLAKVLSQ